jgi:hypothetical protein
MMKKAKIDWPDREFFIGHRHSRGLDVQYDKTPDEDRLFEWTKVINLLTIEVEKELQVYKDEYSKQIQELKAQLVLVQNKIYDRDRARMGLYDNPPKPGHVDISPEELAKVPPPPTQEERKRRLQQEKQSVKVIKV